jgi:hypothetical protein
LVESIKAAVGSRSHIVRVPGAVIPMASRVVGLALHDVVLTRDEYRAMADGLADTDGPSTGQTRLSDWLIERSDDLGRHYANEIERHF